MSMSRAAVSAAIGAAVAAAALGAYAMTVRSATDLPKPVIQANAPQVSTPTLGNAAIDFMDTDIDAIPPTARPPSEGIPQRTMALDHSVPAGAAAREAFGRPQSGVLFRSPDLHDSDDLVPLGRLGLDAVFMQLTEASFDEARMNSSGDTTIFGLAAIPVPASLPFLLGGLLGLRLLTRRRRADQG